MRHQRVLSTTDARVPVRTRVHGLTPAERDAVVAFQGGRCAICGRGGLRLQVDHDHRHCPGPTGCRSCVRGMLCARDNTAIGRFGDENIQRLIAYLSR